MNENHRQGEDKPYADFLNRLRTGEQTLEDLELMKTCVKQRNDPSIPKDEVFIFAENAQVNIMNEAKLQIIDNPEYIIEAKVQHSTMKNYKPRVSNDGSVTGTTLQKTLKIKIGAKVMLTHNLNTADCLTNGALGEILGFDLNADGSVKCIHVQFGNEKVGKDLRKNYQALQRLYPGENVTPISKFESIYNLDSKFSPSPTSTARALQFPLKLAFAVTAHKVQGQTIKKPMKVVVDLKKANKEAQVYVMLSRAQSLDQLIILDELYDKNWRVSQEALQEVKRLEEICENKHLTPDTTATNISNLNIRSLNAHYENLKREPFLEEMDLLCLQETWIGHGNETSKYQMESFDQHLTSPNNTNSSGQGVAVYYKSQFELETDVGEAPQGFNCMRQLKYFIFWLLE